VRFRSSNLRSRLASSVSKLDGDWLAEGVAAGDAHAAAAARRRPAARGNMPFRR
jgi:hypothetical protein